MTHPDIRALIVDDEAPGRTNLRLAIGEHPGWIVQRECATAAEARTVLECGLPVDVIFLDIRMPIESGIQLARFIVAQQEPPLIVFVTAYDNHAVEAFELHAVDYLLKPVHRSRLAQALDHAAQLLSLKQRNLYGSTVRSFLELRHPEKPDGKKHYLQQITIRSVGTLELINVSDILWISAAGNYVELHCGARNVLHRIPLNKLEPELDPDHFIRVHRGAIVRSSQISKLNVVGDGSYSLDLHCCDTVSVSERYVQNVRKFFVP